MALPIALVMVVTVAAFLPLLGFNFNVATDDYFFLLLNPRIKDTSVTGVLNLLTSTSTRYNQFQPVTFLSFWMDYALWGLRPAGYFAFQLLLHLINVMLVYLVVKALSGQALLALVTALVFGIHPLQVDTLALIYERKKLLSTALALLAILQYIKWGDSSKAINYASVVLLFCLSLLADEAWLVLPAVLLAVDYYRNEAFSWSSLWNKIPLILLALIFIGLTLKGQASAGMTTPYHFGSLTSQVELVILIYADFVVSFVFPIGLSTGYTYSPGELHSWRMLGALTLLAALVALFVISWKRRARSICFGLLWFSICVAPFSQVIPYQIVRADHYMYYALIGLAIVAASAIVSALDLERRRRLTIVVIGALTVVLAPLTLTQIRHYRTPYAYIQRFVDTQGWAPSAEVLKARVHQFYGDFGAAERCLAIAIENVNEPVRAGLRLRLADFYVRMGRLEDALIQIDLISHDSPSRPQADKARQTILEAQQAKGLSPSEVTSPGQ